MDMEKLLFPVFAVCRMEDWRISFASPSFYAAFPGAAAGKKLSDVFSGMNEVHRLFSANLPDVGIHACPDGDKKLMIFRWMTIRMENLVPFRFFDVLSLPESLFSQKSNGALNEQALFSVLDSIYDGIWIIDHNGITLWVNKSMQRIANILPEEVIGKHVTAAMELKKFSACVTLHALNAKRSISMFDDYANGKHCLNTSTPIFDEHGNVIKVIAIIRDLTELEDMSLKLEQMKNTSTYMPYSPLMDLEIKHVGKSSASVELQDELVKAAQTDAPILLQGETGTGKTMMAKAIHQASLRKEKSFISLNCGAIPSSLIESELFGYESGAFTGALKKGKPGVFEMADGGTLLLDEISELPFSAQATLLQVLDGDPFRRVGGTSNIHPDVRIIAATNKPLKDMVKKGTFREDLFYRLRVIALELPPLRKRREDILPLLDHFIETMSESGTKPYLSQSLRNALSSYDWPGNIRELRSVARFLLALKKKKLVLSDLPPYVLSELPKAPDTHSGLQEAVEALERDMISRALRETKSTYKAAKLLKVSQSTIVRKARCYNLKEELIQHT